MIHITFVITRGKQVLVDQSMSFMPQTRLSSLDIFIVLRKSPRILHVFLSIVQKIQYPPMSLTAMTLGYLAEMLSPPRKRIAHIGYPGSADKVCLLSQRRSGDKWGTVWCTISKLEHVDDPPFSTLAVIWVSISRSEGFIMRMFKHLISIDKSTVILTGWHPSQRLKSFRYFWLRKVYGRWSH